MVLSSQSWIVLTYGTHNDNQHGEVAWPAAAQAVDQLMVLRGSSPGLAIRAIPSALHEAALLQLEVEGDQQVQRPDGTPSKEKLQDDARNHPCLSQTA